MSESKRPSSDQDPDYDSIVSNDQKRLKVIEKDSKEATVRKIESIVKTQFIRERQLKEIELDTIDQRLYEARKMLDQLRACIVISYYTSEDQEAGPSGKNPGQFTAAHPAVRKLLERMSKTSFPSTQTKRVVTSERVGTLMTKGSIKSSDVVADEKGSSNSGDSAAPLFHVESCEDVSRGARFKLKKRIVVGNVSKYIPVDKREERDQSTHKWMVYVRGSKEEPRIDHFVKKVWFFLHPSYRPNDLVEVNQHPFHLTRRGWGEFPVRIQLQFHDPRNKKVDILHTLKLDKSYTGLQTLGAETLVDVLIYKQEATVPFVVGKSTTKCFTGTKDVGDVVIPASSEETSSVSACVSRKDTMDVVRIKKEPLDDILDDPTAEFDEFVQPTEILNSVEKCSSSRSPPLTNEQIMMRTAHCNSLLPSTSAASNPLAAGLAGGSPSITSKFEEPAKSSDPRPANGLSTFVKCVDKHGNLYLIPLTMFLKLNPETQASVMQSVVSATASDTVAQIASETSVNKSSTSLVRLESDHPSFPCSSSSTSNFTANMTSSPSNNIVHPFGFGKRSVSLLSGVVGARLKSATSIANSTVKLVSLPKIKHHMSTEISNSPVKVTSSSKNQLPSRENTRNHRFSDCVISKLSLDSFESMDLILKYILKYYPLVDSMNEKASHPYCCCSMTTFLSWNIGKRHASEWQRAKTVRTKLVQLCAQCTKWDENQIWSVKKILMFCRHHGYTPMATSDGDVVCAGTSVGSGDIVTYTEASGLLDRLNRVVKCPNELADTDDEDEEVDVLKIDEIQKTKLVSSPAKLTNSSLLRLPSMPSGEFVRETIEQVGTRLGLEEAATDVIAPLAEEVLLAATQSFMEDIMRASHAIAFERNENKRCPPCELTVDDVVRAVSRLPNCDFLTDRFMGTKMQKYHSLGYENVNL